MAHKSIGLIFQPEIIVEPPPPPVPEVAHKIVFGWGQTYKVGSDILAGETISVDFSSIPGVIGAAAAVQEFKGLDFADGNPAFPSDEPWADPPFNGSGASGGTVGGDRHFHVPFDVVSGHDFSAPGWKGMQVGTKHAPNTIDWASDGSDAPHGYWNGTEYHRDGSLIGEGGLDLLSHLGWTFVNQATVTTGVDVYVESLYFGTMDYAFGYCDIRTVDTPTPEVYNGFDYSVFMEGNKVDVILGHNIIAPSGLVIITAMQVATDTWPDTDAGRWAAVTDSTASSDNYSQGRVLTSCYLD